MSQKSLRSSSSQRKRIASMDANSAAANHHYKLETQPQQNAVNQKHYDFQQRGLSPDVNLDKAKAQMVSKANKAHMKNQSSLAQQ